MKDIFKDVLQEVMDCELSEELGYEKSERLAAVVMAECVQILLSLFRAVLNALQNLSVQYLM